MTWTTTTTTWVTTITTTTTTRSPRVTTTTTWVTTTTTRSPRVTTTTTWVTTTTTRGAWMTTTMTWVTTTTTRGAWMTTTTTWVTTTITVEVLDDDNDDMGEDCRAPGRTAGWLAFAARRAGGGRSVRGVPMTAEHAKGALVWIRDDAAVWKAAEIVSATREEYLVRTVDGNEDVRVSKSENIP